MEYVDKNIVFLEYFQISVLSMPNILLTILGVQWRSGEGGGGGGGGPKVQRNQPSRVSREGSGCSSTPFVAKSKRSAKLICYTYTIPQSSSILRALKGLATAEHLFLKIDKNINQTQ